jgi:hypothetical protein
MNTKFAIFFLSALQASASTLRERAAIERRAGASDSNVLAGGYGEG